MTVSPKEKSAQTLADIKDRVNFPGGNRADVVGRLVLTADIETLSPLLIGTGGGDGFTDSLVLKDKQDRPFIPGSSVAGVMRAAFPQYDKYFGYLGAKRKPGDGRQSSVIFSDVPLKNTKIIVRDSVRLDSVTGTAVKTAKFDYEAVERGATGELQIAAVIRAADKDCAGEMLDLFGEIGGRLRSGRGVAFGAHTAKGFGQVKATDIWLDVYDFSDFAAVAAWLTGGDAPLRTSLAEYAAAYDENEFTIDARFAVNSSLLVRSDDSVRLEEWEKKLEKDKVSNFAVMLKSGDDFVIPGASWRGVIRHRSEAICRTIGVDLKKLDRLFGIAGDAGEKSRKSSFFVSESYIAPNSVKEAHQTRNRLDRFTGGTIDQALFTDVPIWRDRGGEPVVNLRLAVKPFNLSDDILSDDKKTVRSFQPWACGLILLVLKDLWLGDLAVGGGRGIGRGTLRGVSAEIRAAGKKLTVREDNGGFYIDGDREFFESCVQNLLAEGRNSHER